MWHYDIKDLGFNYRLTEFQSALGISQLDKLEKFIKRRNQIAKIYDEGFREEENITIPEKNLNIRHSYHLYPLKINFKNLGINKIKFFKYMSKKNINFQVHYIPIHYHKYYQKKFNLKKGMFPICENFFKEEVSLPIFYSLKNKDVKKIIRLMKNYLFK